MPNLAQGSETLNSKCMLWVQAKVLKEFRREHCRDYKSYDQTAIEVWAKVLSTGPNISEFWQHRKRLLEYGEGLRNPDLFKLLDGVTGEASKLNELKLMVTLLIVNVWAHLKKEITRDFLEKSLRYGLRGAREIRLQMGSLH